MPSSLLQVVNSLFQTCYNKLGTSSASTTCRQLVNRRVTTCLQTCYNLCVFTCVRAEVFQELDIANSLKSVINPILQGFGALEGSY